MSETVQMVLVTLVAVAALVVLVRPLFARSSPGSKARGCSNCSSAPAPTRRS